MHCDHNTTYIGCESCVERYVAEREAAGQLTGIDRENLEPLRIAYPSRGSQDRRPDAASQLDALISEWMRGEVS